jgi:hypothetical protein
MKRIELTGKHAIGDHQFCLVDDDDYVWLSQWKWKAKPNGSNNNTYAVRNYRIGRKTITIRMHREILGLDRYCRYDTDHINHNPLDNCRQNLRIVSRSENLLNARRKCIRYTCAGCNRLLTESVALMSRTKRYCSKECRKRSSNGKASFVFCSCVQCGEQIVASMRTRMFCSDSCRKRHKRTRSPNMDERLIAAASVPRTLRELSVESGVHESDVRRLLPSLELAGHVARISPGLAIRRGRPMSVWLRGDLAQ